MRPALTVLGTILILSASLSLAGQATAEDGETGLRSAVAQAMQIIKTKILPRYETAAGFSVKPLAIKYQDDPTIAKSLDQYGSIWKQLDPVVADGYASIQRKVNDHTRPEAVKYRALLIDAFRQAVELRGGGSASVQLSTFAPAEAEWIIAQFGTAQYDAVTDEAFISRLSKALSVTGANPQRRDIQAVLAKLKAAERFLNKEAAAVMRAEFLTYFEAGS